MTSRVWGVSRIRDLKICPRMYISKYETKPKRWVEVPSPQMDRGSRIHKTLEDSIKYDLALEKELASVDGFVQQLVEWKNQGIVVLPEFKFGLTTTFNRCEFFSDPKLRVRAALDVFVKDDRKLLIIDWKTGRYKPEHRFDARFYGAATWVSTPNVDSCTVIYPYIDNPADTFEEVIQNPEAIMTDAYDSFDKADAYLDKLDGKQPMNPGGYCNWCGDIECRNNKNYRAKELAALKLKELF